jgi:hypothetical protein
MTFFFASKHYIRLLTAAAAAATYDDLTDDLIEIRTPACQHLSPGETLAMHYYCHTDWHYGSIQYPILIDPI